MKAINTSTVLSLHCNSGSSIRRACVCVSHPRCSVVSSMDREDRPRSRSPSRPKVWPPPPMPTKVCWVSKNPMVGLEWGFASRVPPAPPTAVRPKVATGFQPIPPLPPPAIRPRVVQVEQSAVACPKRAPTEPPSGIAEAPVDASTRESSASPPCAPVDASTHETCAWPYAAVDASTSTRVGNASC